MPSVGMRRSTRVFGARLLRSGRRLRTVQYDGSKYVRAAHRENKWSELLENAVGGDAGNFYKDMVPENANNGYLGMTAEPRVEDAMEVKNVDTMYGLVYKRKRQRMELGIHGLTEDERYGKKFARKQWRKKCRYTESFKICGDSQEFALVVNKSFCDSGYWITCLLTSVLSYMSKVRIGMRRLSAFLLSRPLFDAYSLCGQLFLQDSVNAKNPGICRISGYSSLIPLFHVDSSALPSLFVHMRTSMHLRFSRLACVLVAHSSGVFGEVDNVMDLADDDEHPFQISMQRDHKNCIEVAPQIPLVSMSHSDKAVSGNDKSSRRELSNSAGGLHKYGLRSKKLRSNRKIKKRSSLRHKRVRPPSAFRTQRVSEALYSDVFRIRQGGVQPSRAASCRVLSSPVKQAPVANNRKSKSILGLLRRNACSCTANLLVSESDKCYREEGATVTLKSSGSNHWFIAVIINGTTWCLAPQKAMQPPCNNRFTHATIWTTDDGWKLEFPCKQDWWVFKELYKECHQRNIRSSINVIPVPGVHEVSSTKDAEYLPYVRPDSYITMKDDELVRALGNMSASYDMDSGDEMWLEKLNEELYPGKDQEELITPDSFELIIDALEKWFHWNPDEHLDERAAYDYCMHLERRESIDAVRNYWIKKRKYNCSALVKIFQLYQPRRAQVIPKSVLRKKRSFKRQATQGGRGKQPLLQAIVAKRDVASEQQNVHKLQEAKAAAERFEGLAVVKRQRAQILMENADLATYKALMALRIAEAPDMQMHLFFLAN